MAWLAGYSYRKEIDISRASGAVSNYQMKLLVGESSGATGEDVDCAGHILSNFNDLRFTAADGTTLLDYWIESITGATPNQLATVWIEFDSIGTGATNFYMYYGNAGAAAASNGANTFIQFDDFETGNDGDTIAGIWNEGNPHCHISTEQDIGNVAGYFGTRAVKLVGAASYPSLNLDTFSASNNIAIRLRYYKEDAGRAEIVFGNGTYLIDTLLATDENVTVYNGASYIDITLDCKKDAWGLLEFKNFDFTGATMTMEIDGVSKTAIDISNSSTYAGFYIDGYSANNDVWFDNFIIRNYRATEPTWGSWGAEEGETVVKDLIQSGIIAFPR